VGGGAAIDVTSTTTPCGVRRWTPRTGASELLTYDYLAGRKRTPNDVAYLTLSPDGRRLYAANRSGSLLATWTDVGGALPSGSYTVIGPADQGASALTAVGNDLVAVASAAGEVRVYDQQHPLPSPLESAFLLPALDLAAQALAFLPDASRLVAGDRAGRIRFFDVAPAAFPSRPMSAFTRPELPGGILLAKAPFAPLPIGGSGEHVAVRDGSDGPELVRLGSDGAVKARFTGIKGSPRDALVLDGAGLVVGKGELDAGLTVWSLDGARKFGLGGETLPIDDAAFSPDGKTALTRDGAHARTTLWHLGTIEELARGICAELKTYRATHPSPVAEGACQDL
jgi:WD40 repeat protein